tara:strand:- start:4174 stop:6165 length:1992 start_codon:yes stop_codon:yes gene_type:complete
MRRRALIAAGATLLLLIAVATTALHIYFDDARLRRLVLPPLESAIGRSVEIDGIGLTVWTGLGASIDGLRISDRQGFGDGLFLSADHASITLSLFSALSGDQGLGEMQIDRPRVYIVVNQRGVANYGDLVASGETDRPTSIYLPVDRFRLSDGSVTYADHRDNSQTVLRGVDYKLQLGVEDQTVSAAGQLSIAALVFTTEDTATSHSGAELAHDATLDLRRAKARIRRLALTAGSISLEASGEIDHLDKIPVLDLTVRQVNDQIDISSPGNQVNGTLELDIAMKGQLGASQNPPVYPSLTGWLGLTNLTASSDDLSAPIEDGILQVRFESTSAILDTMGVRVGESDLGLTGRLDGATAWLFGKGRPHLTIELNSNHLDLDALLPETTAVSAGLTFTTPLYASVPAPASPIPDLLRTMDGAGRLNLKRIVSGATLTEVNARFRSRRGVLRVQNLSGSLYGGTLSGNLTVDASRETPSLPVDGKFNIGAARADGVLQNLFGLPVPLQGRMDMELGFNGLLDSTLTLQEDRLSATGQGAVADGQIINWGWLKETAGGVSQLSFLDFDHIPVKDLKSHFSVRNGRVRIEGLTVTTGDIPSRLDGSVGLDGSLDCALKMEIPSEKLKIGGVNIGKALGSLLGRQPDSIPVTLNFDGTVDRPSMTVRSR